MHTEGMWLALPPLSSQVVPTLTKEDFLARATAVLVAPGKDYMQAQCAEGYEGTEPACDVVCLVIHPILISQDIPTGALHALHDPCACPDGTQAPGAAPASTAGA